MSGSRALSAFLVELGAPMMVASTMVPVLTLMPRACSSLPVDSTLQVSQIANQI